MRVVILVSVFCAVGLGCAGEYTSIGTGPEPEIVPLEDNAWQQGHNAVGYWEQTGIDEFTPREAGTASFTWRFTGYQEDTYDKDHWSSSTCIPLRNCDTLHGEYRLTLHNDLPEDSWKIAYSFAPADEDLELYNGFGSGALGTVVVAAGDSSVVNGEFKFRGNARDIPFLSVKVGGIVELQAE